MDSLAALRTAEGKHGVGKHGVVGYRVPARLVDKQMLHIRGLESWVNVFKCSLPGQIDEKRNVRCVRRYGH